MIEKVKEKLRDHPTWRGILILAVVLGVALASFSLISSWVLANRVAKQVAVDEVNIAVGNRIDELGEILEGFRKLEITQNQNVNVGGDTEKLRDKRVREILVNRGELKE